MTRYSRHSDAITQLEIVMRARARLLFRSRGAFASARRYAFDIQSTKRRRRALRLELREMHATIRALHRVRFLADMVDAYATVETPAPVREALDLYFGGKR